MDEHSILAYPEPITGHTLEEYASIERLDFDAHSGHLALELALSFPYAQYQQALSEGLLQHLQKDHPSLKTLGLTLSYQSVSRQTQGAQPIANVTNVIAVASGKGGVGKSTTAVNLAIALAQNGAAVGLLDADIYGPSIPDMTGLSGKPESPDGKKIIPKIAHGIEIMSIGFLVNPDDALIWRGPMATGALEQIIRDTMWGYNYTQKSLDFLIIDMPPGTGDIQLTLSQKIPLSGAIAVTTPQDIALADVVRAIKMFEKVKVPILGVVENMSTHICSACGHEEAIFGSGGADKLEKQFNAKLLGQLPLDRHIREALDAGIPSTSEKASETAHQQRYYEIAIRMAAALAGGKRDYSRAFPKITIE